MRGVSVRVVNAYADTQFSHSTVQLRFIEFHPGSLIIPSRTIFENGYNNTEISYIRSQNQFAKGSNPTAKVREKKILNVCELHTCGPGGLN